MQAILRFLWFPSDKNDGGVRGELSLGGRLIFEHHGVGDIDREIERERMASL